MQRLIPNYQAPFPKVFESSDENNLKRKAGKIKFSFASSRCLLYMKVGYPGNFNAKEEFNAKKALKSTHTESPNFYNFVNVEC